MSTPAFFDRELSSAPQPTVRELALSAAWHGGIFTNLVTTDGHRLRVVHRGTWSHGFGPDFTGAMLETDTSTLVTGDVEIHLDAADWYRHGHHTDPRYNQVVLHVVLQSAETRTQREDGQIVPVVVATLPDDVLFSIDRALPAIWDQLGSSVCAQDLAHRDPQRIRAALHRLGDQRLYDRATRFEGEIDLEPASRVLLRGLFDAFGYSMNRPPMGHLYQQLAETGLLNQWLVDPASFPPEDAQALIFGLAGFLPLSPGEAHLASLTPEEVGAIEERWRHRFAWLAGSALSPTGWVRTRTRPANHPAARLASLARLMSACGADPLPILHGAIVANDDVRELLRSLSQAPDGTRLGLPRATAIAASVVLPLMLALAQRTGDADLEDAVLRSWSALPRSEWSRPALRAREQAAGDASLGRLGERAIQGLLHLDRQLCGPRRCFECPIAAEVLADRRRQHLARENSQEMSSVLPT